MWLIFIIACIVVALAALFVVWIGSKVFRSIGREDRIEDQKADIEAEFYEKIKREIRKDDKIK